jgi:hypothetical protein
MSAFVPVDVSAQTGETVGLTIPTGEKVGRDASHPVSMIVASICFAAEIDISPLSTIEQSVYGNKTIQD